MAGLLWRTADRALTVASVLGVAALLGVVLAAVLGVRPLFFRSGSMAPAIDTGSMAVARQVPAADLRVGDVVSVTTAAGVRVTHRVVAMQPSGRHVRLTLRGDANRSVDPEGYTVDSAYRVFWHVPWIGYAVAAMLTPVGLFALGLGTMGLLVLAARRDRTPRTPRPPRGGRRRRRSGHRRRSSASRLGGRRVAVTAAATAVVLTGPAQVAPASAAPLTDSATVSGTTFTTTPVPVSTLSCGALGVLSVTFNWTAVAGATSYTLHYGFNGSTILITTATSATIIAAISGGTAWVEVNHDYGWTTWTSVASNTRTYTVAVVSLCA